MQRSHETKSKSCMLISSFIINSLASCTLDGCVKIYTSRVDSVATETTKLLGGLATSSSMASRHFIWLFYYFVCEYLTKTLIVLLEGREGEDAENAEDNEEETDKPAKKKVLYGASSGLTINYILFMGF